MKTIKGPAIFLAQFADDKAPFNNLKNISHYMADLGYKPFILSPNYNMVDASLVQKAHTDGIKVIPWTANTKEEINRLKALKVDGIITDYPNLF